MFRNTGCKWIITSVRAFRSYLIISLMYVRWQDLYMAADGIYRYVTMFVSSAQLCQGNVICWYLLQHESIRRRVNKQINKRIQSACLYVYVCVCVCVCASIRVSHEEISFIYFLITLKENVFYSCPLLKWLIHYAVDLWIINKNNKVPYLLKVRDSFILQVGLTVSL